MSISHTRIVMIRQAIHFIFIVQRPQQQEQKIKTPKSPREKECNVSILINASYFVKHTVDLHIMV
jgi:hypothetical protein